MKKVDVSVPIMKEVARFERARITRFLLLFAAGAAVFASVLLYILFSIAADLAEKQAFDVLALFREDPEIIRDFLAEVLGVFWIEFPKELAIAGLAAAAAAIFLFLRTNKRRIRNNRTLRQLEKYS